MPTKRDSSSDPESDGSAVVLPAKPVVPDNLPPLKNIPHMRPVSANVNCLRIDDGSTREEIQSNSPLQQQAVIIWQDPTSEGSDNGSVTIKGTIPDNLPPSQNILHVRVHSTKGDHKRTPSNDSRSSSDGDQSSSHQHQPLFTSSPKKKQKIKIKQKNSRGGLPQQPEVTSSPILPQAQHLQPTRPQFSSSSSSSLSSHIEHLIQEARDTFNTGKFLPLLFYNLYNCFTADMPMRRVQGYQHQYQYRVQHPTLPPLQRTRNYPIPAPILPPILAGEPPSYDHTMGDSLPQYISSVRQELSTLTVGGVADDSNQYLSRDEIHLSAMEGVKNSHLRSLVSRNFPSTVAKLFFTGYASRS